MSPSRGVRSRRGTPWDEQSIRVALSEFLDDWDVWPTYEQFIQGGAKGLRDALASIGGVQKWASEMGLPGGDRARGGVKKWNDETIRATLSEFFGDRTTWPTRREFNEAGLHALYEALRVYGGVQRWAKEMGVVRRFERPAYFQPKRRAKPKRQSSPPRLGDWPKWNEQRIAAELAAFLAGREDWPRQKEFVDSGRKSLYNAVLKHGGTLAWAQRMGVRRVKRHGGRLPQSTDGSARQSGARRAG